MLLRLARHENREARVEKADEPLLAQLMALTIGPCESVLTFEARLARENGWRAAHARRVMVEYRRFLYLAATAPASCPVTPSDAVDQAWHLHLSYSRDYWDRLCRDLIGKPLHHGPTAGGAAEGQRYRQQYQATLERYTALFGAPPRDIWPDVDERFAGRMRRVDARHHIVLPRVPVLVGGAMLGASLLVACAASDAASEGSFLFAAIVVALLAFIVVAVARREQGPSKKKNSADGNGCGSSDSQSDSSCDDGGGSGCGGGGCGGGGD
jgi:hypothetical protein